MAQPTLVRDTTVVSLLSRRQFLVQWLQSPETDILFYNIYRSENQFSGFSLVGQVAIPSTQFVDTVPFTFGVNFYWKVTAINNADQESDIDSTESVSDITIGQFDEEPFKQVNVQAQDFVYNETPGGPLNGSNVVFTTVKVFRAGTLQVFWNGVLIDKSSFTENITTHKSFTLIGIVPVPTDTLTVTYIKLEAFE